MTSLLIHPSVMAAPQQVHSSREAKQAITTVLSWGKVQTSGEHPLFMSLCTQLALCESRLLWDMEHLKRLHQRFSDGTWTPWLVFQAVKPLLDLALAEECLADGESIEQQDGLRISPSYVEDELLPGLVSAARHDAALLLREKDRQREDFDWVVAVACQSRQEKRFDVSVQGPVVIRRNTQQQPVVLNGSLVYVVDPEHIVVASNDDRLFSTVRQRVAGMRALLMGGDGRNFDEAELCRLLGLESIQFLKHYGKAHGENIRRAQNTLKAGKIDVFLPVTKFTSHATAELKAKCPTNTHYVPVNQSPTAKNIALALAREFKLKVV
jgi:hypothetical protein